MNTGLTEMLVQNGYLKSRSIIHAFNKITRVDFVPPELESRAEMDVALPIGLEQTISQPSTVATMLELLDPKRGQQVLDIGSGSGWTSAMLADIVGSQGKVVAVEIIPELHEMTKRNVEKFGFVSSGTVECILNDGNRGYEPLSPYDRILVSASADEIPWILKEQLVIGGKMIIPIRESLVYIEKRGENDFYK